VVDLFALRRYRFQSQNAALCLHVEVVECLDHAGVRVRGTGQVGDHDDDIGEFVPVGRHHEVGYGSRRQVGQVRITDLLGLGLDEIRGELIEQYDRRLASEQV
jgi:hypothetical protein